MKRRNQTVALEHHVHSHPGKARLEELLELLAGLDQRLPLGRGLQELEIWINKSASLPSVLIKIKAKKLACGKPQRPSSWEKAVE